MDLNDHYNSALPDLGAWRGVGDIAAGLAHAALGGLLVAATPEIGPGAPFSLSAGITGLAAGSVQIGLGIAELMGGPTLSSQQWELISEFASPTWAPVLATAGLVGDQETMEKASTIIGKIELAEALNNLGDPGKTDEALEKLDAALKVMETTFSEAFKDSLLFKGDPTDPGDSRSNGEPGSGAGEGDQGNRDFDSGSGETA